MTRRDGVLGKRTQRWRLWINFNNFIGKYYNNDVIALRCEAGEAGVFIGKINKKHAANTFGGYADKVGNLL